MSATTLNTAVASGSLVEAFINFFKSFAVKGTPAAASEAAWADGARFI